MQNMHTLGKLSLYVAALHLFISSINVTEQSSLEVPIKTCILHIWME